MTKVNSISACENICRDFLWSTEILDIIVRLAPWAALIWAVLAFFRKRKDDRHAVDIGERRRIYLQLLEAVHSMRRKHVRNEQATMWDYYMILDKIKLVYPRKIPMSLKNHEQAIRYFLRTDLSENPDDAEIFDQMRQAEENAFACLLEDLREDLDIPASGEK